MTRTISVAVLLLAAACGGGGSDAADDAERTARTDSAGNVIEADADWSGVGDPGDASDAGEDNEENAAAAGGAGDRAEDAEPPCGVPTTTPEQSEVQAPPGFDPDAPLTEPNNDFPMEATISPSRGDPGETVKVSVVAVGQPNAMVAMLARFYDGHHHGMRAAKFADATGRAVFEGPVPESAPVGISKITVSVSNQNEQSALAVLDFVVTGPGCP